MDFGLSRTIQLVFSLRSASELVADLVSDLSQTQVRAISKCLDSSNLCDRSETRGNQLASRSQTCCEPFYDQVRATSTCRDSLNLVVDRFAADLRPDSELLASRIAPDRPKYITSQLASWFAIWIA